MARQKGIIKLDGTIGDITFYKTKDGDLARQKGGISADRIANDPAFARTRENGAEFGSAGSSGKLLRDSIRPMTMSASDSKVTSRLTQIMTQILKLDTASVRGKRTPAVGLAGAPGKALLKGFDFNADTILGSVLFKPFTVNTTSGVITINGLVPVNDLAFPTNATHVSLSGAFGNINFGTGVVDVRYTNIVNLPINATSANVTLTPTAVPAGTGIKVFLLKIEFFQMVNTIQYSLKNGAYNALANVEVA